MRLPEDKKERKKILILIAIGIGAIGYVGYMFVLSPFLLKQQQAATHVSEFEDKLRRASKDIDMTPRNLEKNTAAISHILEISDIKRQILRPNLGNYLLVADDIIGRHADALGLEIDSISETAASGAPISDDADANGPRLKAYSVNVSLSCSLHDVYALLRAIESENPYLCITRLGVIGQPQTPTEHAVSFDVQWPIWADPTHPVRLAAERMSDEEKH